MRLKLNRTLRAALIAAITAAGFTLSQAQAEEVHATETLNTVRALSDYTGTNFTLTNLSLTTSTTEGTTPTGGNFVSPRVNVGNGGTWALTFTVTNTSGHDVTLNSLALDVIMYNNGGSTQNTGTKRTIAFDLTADQVSLTTVDVALDAGGSLTTPATICDPEPLRGGKPTLVFDGGYELTAGQAVTFTLNAARGTVPGDSYNAGCFHGLQDMVANFSYEVTSSTWKGTEAQHNWSESDSWSFPVSEGAAVVFDGTAVYKTATVDVASTVASISVSNAVHTFELANNLTTGTLTIATGSGLILSQSGTMDVTGTATLASGALLNVNRGATLKLHDAATAAQLLQTVTGEGNITLASNTEFVGTAAKEDAPTTKATGVLTLDHCTLKVGNMTINAQYAQRHVNMESFNGIQLDNAQFWYHAAPMTIKNVSVVNGTSSIYIEDTGNKNEQYLTLAGTTNVSLDSTLQFLGHWKGQAGIALLDGDGTLELAGPGGNSIYNIGGGSIGKLQISSNVISNVTGNLTLGGLTGTQGTVNAAKNLTFTGAGTYSYTGTLAVGGQIIKTGAGTQTISGTALYHTILAQGGTLVLTGTYDISGIAPSTDPTYVNGDSPYIASGNGFKHTEGKVHVVNIAGGILSADTATFTYGSEQRTGLDEEGYFTLSGSTDYSVLCVNNNGGVSYNAAWDVAQAQSTNITSVVMADGVTTLTADKEDASFTLAITGTGTVNATKDATVTALTGTGKLIVGGEKTVTVQSISGYSGEYEVAEGAMLQIVTNNAPASLTVDGNGALRLLTNQGGQNTDLKTVTASNLYLGADANHNSRFMVNSSTNLDGVSHLYFDGGQLWLDQAGLTYSGDVTFLTTTYTEGNAFGKAAMRVHHDGTFSGAVEVQDTAKLAWGVAGKMIEFSGDLTGNGNIELRSYNTTTGTFRISGDTSGYHGAILSDAPITLDVANGAALTINSGSDIKGAVTLGTGSSLTVTGDGDSIISGVISGDGGIVKDGDGTLTLKGANTYTGTTEVKAGKLVVEGSIASQDVILGEKASIENKGTGAITLSDVDEQLTQVENIGSGTLELKNATGTLSVVDLTIAAGSTISFHDKADTPAEGTITVTETLTAGGGTLLANLVLEGGAMLDLGGAGENALTLGSNLAFVNGGLVTLDEATLAQLDALVMGTSGNYLELVKAAEGTTLTYGGAYNDLWFGELFDRPDTLVGDFKVVATDTSFGLTKVSNIPEPTTGTLSLLALAALAARRRKHN